MGNNQKDIKAKTIALDDSAPEVRVILSSVLAKKIIAEIKDSKEDASVLESNTIEVLEVKDKNKKHDKSNSVGHN
jgi:hypothetical protein